MQSGLFDVIETEGRTYRGVIDYVTTKHIVIYDIADQENPDVTMMVVIWRMHYPHMRFSLFKNKFLPHIDVPAPVLVTKRRIINEINENVERVKPTRSIKRRISIEA